MRPAMRQGDDYYKSLRERFVNDPWEPKENGNYGTKLLSVRVTFFKKRTRYGMRWAFVFDGIFSRNDYSTLEGARDAAFMTITNWIKSLN